MWSLCGENQYPFPALSMLSMLLSDSGCYRQLWSLLTIWACRISFDFSMAVLPMHHELMPLLVLVRSVANNSKRTSTNQKQSACGCWFWHQGEEGLQVPWWRFLCWAIADVEANFLATRHFTRQSRHPVLRRTVMNDTPSINDIFVLCVVLSCFAMC